MLFHCISIIKSLIIHSHYTYTISFLLYYEYLMVLDASQHYKVQIKGKWNHPGKGVALCPTPWCTCY